MGDVADILGVATKPTVRTVADEAVRYLETSRSKSAASAAIKSAQKASSGVKAKGLRKEMLDLIEPTNASVPGRIPTGPSLSTASSVPTPSVGLMSPPVDNVQRRPRGKWTHTPIITSARRDGQLINPAFFHWVCTGRALPDYPYARFNVKLPLLEFKEEEFIAAVESVKQEQANSLRIKEEELTLKTPNAEEAIGSSTIETVSTECSEDVKSPTSIQVPKEHTSQSFSYAESVELCRMVVQFDERWAIIKDRWPDNLPTRSVTELQLHFKWLQNTFRQNTLPFGLPRGSTTSIRNSEEVRNEIAAQHHAREKEEARRLQQMNSFLRTREEESEIQKLKEELRSIDSFLKKARAAAKARATSSKLLAKANKRNAALAANDNVDTTTTNGAEASGNIVGGVGYQLPTVLRRLPQPSALSSPGHPTLASDRLYFTPSSSSNTVLTEEMIQYLENLQMPPRPIGTQRVCALVESIRELCVQLFNIKNGDKPVTKTAKKTKATKTAKATKATKTNKMNVSTESTPIEVKQEPIPSSEQNIPPMTTSSDYGTKVATPAPRKYKRNTVTVAVKVEPSTVQETGEVLDEAEASNESTTQKSTVGRKRGAASNSVETLAANRPKRSRK